MEGLWEQPCQLQNCRIFFYGNPPIAVQGYFVPRALTPAPAQHCLDVALSLSAEEHRAPPRIPGANGPRQPRNRANTAQGAVPWSAGTGQHPSLGTSHPKPPGTHGQSRGCPMARHLGTQGGHHPWGRPELRQHLCCVKNRKWVFVVF